MTWYPISNSPLQFMDSNGDPYDAAVIKFYAAGTTTPLTISADTSGTTTAAYATLDSGGYTNISNSKAIIHVEQTYKMVMYPDQCNADDNLGAVWSIDNIDPQTTGTFTSLTISTFLDVNGHITIGAGADPGTSGDNVLVIENGTAPTTSTANTVQVYSVDLSAGNTMLALYTEGTPLSGGTTQVGTMAIKLNGTTQYLLTSQTAGAGQTLNGITFVERKDTVYPIVDGGSVDIDPGNGLYQYWDLGANRTPSDSIEEGQTVYVGVSDGVGPYSVDWTTTMGVVWTNNSGSAQTLPTSGYGWHKFWKVNSVLYGFNMNV